MATFAFENFGRNLVGRAADGPLLLPVELEFGGQPEVSQLQFHLVRQEQVAQLQVPVDHFVFVQVSYATQHLQYLALNFNFSQSFSTTDFFIYGLIYTQF